MWCHFQAWTPSNSSDVHNSRWQFFLKPYSWRFGKIPIAINIKGELKESYHVQNLSNEHDNFEFQDGLLYHDGFLYVLDDPTKFQILQAKHDTLNATHFGYKTMQLVS